MSERKVRVRFAPSPTGPLHIGGVRTALYNYLFARQHGGDLVFRIEDTDSNRFVPGAEDYILESFRWLGIQFDEGVSFGGEHGPYRQSERRDIYKKYVKLLLDAGKAYIAFDTPEELTKKREEIENFQYDAHTRGMMRNSITLGEEETQRLIEAGSMWCASKSSRAKRFTLTTSSVATCASCRTYSTTRCFTRVLTSSPLTTWPTSLTTTSWKSHT